MLINSSNYNNSYTVDLLTKILMKYPVINTVNLDLYSNTLELSFLIKIKTTDNDWNKIKNRIHQKIRIFNKLEKNNEFHLKIIKEDHNTLTNLKLISKLNQLSASEIDFIIKIIKQNFSTDILTGKIEKNKFKLNSIEELLELIKTERDVNYFGFRDENKIFIYE